MSARLEQAAPLTGIVFLALLVSSFIVGGTPPDADGAAVDVVAFWREHAAAQIASAILAGLAAVVLVSFAAVVRTTLRDSDNEPKRSPSIAFAGFLLIATGGLALAGFQFAAADTAGDVPSTVTQTLAVLNRDFFFILDGGVLIAVFASAAAILRSRTLPRWFGYGSIAVGLVFLTPAFSVAFPAFGIWILTLSLLPQRPATIHERK